MIYLNDHNERTSRPVQLHEIPEIAGISADEFRDDYDSDITALNADLYEFSFSANPMYTTADVDA